MQNKPLHLTVRHALRQYKRYKRKYTKLRHLSTVSSSKIDFLKKRIERLKTYLKEMVQKVKLVAAAGALALVLGSTSANAQTFGPDQINAFGLNPGTNVGVTSTMADLDNDGDLDLLSGSKTGAFLYFQNTGTATAPSFAALVSNPFGFTNLPAADTYSYPVFVDLDNDGDFDVLSGCADGNIIYYQNTGTASAPAFAMPVVNPFGLAIAGAFTTLTVGDLDSDGDFDILEGVGTSGVFRYYQNTGTASAPAFATGVTDPFGLSFSSLFPTPSLVDIDNDGDLDLFSGEYDGDFFYYENTGTALAPAFGPETVNPFGITGGFFLTATSFADLDNDGDMDLMGADYYDGFHYFENTTCSGPPAPTNTTAAADLAVCEGSTTTLTATGTGTISWYTAATGGTYLGSGGSFTTPEITANTSFFVQDSTCAESPRTEVAVTVNLLPDVSTATSGATITANLGGATYQWLDCNNAYAPIGSETGQSFTATANGDYAVLVNDGTCADTSHCENIIITGIHDVAATTQLSVFPNPANGEFTIQSSEAGNFVLQNEMGQVVQSIVLHAGNANTVRINGLSNGVYFITGVNNGSVVRQKVVVTK